MLAFRLRRNIATGCVVGALAAAWPAAAAMDGPPVQPSCACSTKADPELSATGLVWQGTDRLGLADVAALAAPVLWFSADEPLLVPGLPPVPGSHPCDTPASGPVVYYQVARMAHRGSAPVGRPEEDDPAFFDKVHRLVLRFFFYYPRDVGRTGHVHDLEGVDMEIVLEDVGGCRRVRVARVEGLAHGNRWYSNILRVTTDTKWPMTVLVERGKHASAPDRDADGRFVRGYDVTARVNDAWGVRDLRDPGRRRAEAFRVLPPEEPRLCVPAPRSSVTHRASLGRYTLRPANRVRVCETPVNGTFLTEMMDYHGFGEAQVPVQWREGSPGGTLRRLPSPDQWLSLAARGVGSQVGAAIVVRGLDLRPGWLVPRFTVDGTRASAQVMFTPSASRRADVYVSAGAQRQFETVTETLPNWAAVVEGGVKFRAEIPRTLRPFLLGTNFGGVRVGVLGTGGPTADRWQLIWEVGVGAW